MSKNTLSPQEELSRIKGNVIRLVEYWKKFTDESGPISAFSKQMLEVINGEPVKYIYPNCAKCEEEGNEECPWYGEPDGCNNRELKCIVMERQQND